MSRATYSSWNGSQFVDHHAKKTIFHPNTTSYLLDRPLRAISYGRYYDGAGLLIQEQTNNVPVNGMTASIVVDLR